MQLASSIAVGLAMFLPAILFPVFLVALENQKKKGQERDKTQSYNILDRYDSWIFCISENGRDIALLTTNSQTLTVSKTA